MKSINRYRIMTALFLGVFGYVPLWGQNIDFTPDKPDGPANIQSALWELAMPGAGKRVGGLQDTVVVILVPHVGQGSASIDTSSLAALGGKVLAQSKSLMRIAVPPSSLLAVSELPGVRFVRKPYRPHPQVLSKGASRIGALANHSAGVKGQGVKVAIIDEGFKGARHLPGDMPARWQSFDFTDEGIYTDDESVHGTACAEIIHDVAPEAELTLLKVGDLVDLENAKDLCIREGIDIINHSMTWYGTGIGDGKGLACDIVNDAADNGILWVNAASNSAKSHYFQPWSNPDSNKDRWHNFNGEDETIGFQAERGTEISIYLTWNDWPETRDNYDLYLYFSNSSGGLERNPVAQSTDVQSGSHKPVEWIEYKAERSGQYHILVSKSPDARSRRLKIWSFHHNLDFEYSSPEGSIGIPADAEGAMSVGAIYYDHYNLGRIADYSSRGPTLDNRYKPELVAPTGVSTVSYSDRNGYHGTSAAAPHVAGAAALIKSANPSYSRTQLWEALIEATVDIGDWGQDNTFGHGKLVLPVLPQELPSAGPFGYSPPVVTRNIRSAKFGFGWSNRDLYCYFSAKEINRGEVDIFLNDQKYGSIPANWDWKRWYLRLDRTDLRSGQNTIEFRNIVNQNRTSSFVRWQLKDVSVTPQTPRRPANAKPVAGPQLLSELPDGLVSGLGDPFPTPFNAEVTIPFTTAAAGSVRLTVYNLMGQSIRVLADDWTEAGLHQVRWDGRTAKGAEAASGVYWAVLHIGDAVQTAKLVLIR